ncbi:MAG: VWA domain-containing protein [Pyrinomonadaceae bacterium]|nr:VWA domain-containing protein [Pyrinomonadaceae bacterium]
MSYYRRLPVYLLIDCSESMAGDGFTAVNQGLAAMIGQLRGNPMALESAFISLITFASSAQQVVPLTDILKFQMPRLKLGSGTSLGAGLRLWLECMDRELVQTTAQQKGDYKPICFLLTDGEPTDEWERVADQVRTTVVGKKANVIALACGPDVDINKLRRITETVLVIKDTEPASFSEFFKWVSASVSTASQKIEGAGERGLGLPNLPDNVQVAQAGDGRGAPDPDRYIFIHARCVKNRGFYILRYGKVGHGQGRNAIYQAVAAHRVDDFEFDQTAQGKMNLQISADNLQDAAPCPYCQNPVWAMCGNGHVHCCPLAAGTLSLTCPWCNKTDRYGEGSFEVGRGIG